MNPTQEQLNARLNPTAVNLSIPSEGSVFRSDGPTSDVIFMIKNGQLQQVSLTSLGFEAEKAAGRLTMTQYGWDGPATHQQNGLMKVGLSQLKQQYGIDFNSIPTKPEGQIADLAGLVRDGKLQQGTITDFNQVKTALAGTPSAGSVVTVNNTPNTLSTTLGQAAKGTQLPPPSVNLQPGATGEDVKKLQDYLVSKGLMTQAEVDTGYGTYGPKTTAAVAKLQQQLGVDNSSGVGYFGPKTMAAISGSTSTSGTSVSGGGSASSAQDKAVQDILNNTNISADQKALLQKFFETISTNDVATANKIIAGFNAATEYSSPYFKAQTLIATDALSRAIGASEGDLAFNEKKLRDTLNDLQATTSASKDQLSFQHSQELKKLADSYKVDLENTQQNLASLGKTSSSVRTQSEQLLSEQNQGLVESSTRQFSYQTGNLDRSLAGTTRDVSQSLAYLQDKATQDRIANLRKTEEQVGSSVLSSLGYTGLLGNVGGDIPRRQVTDSLSFANSFVF